MSSFIVLCYYHIKLVGTLNNFNIHIKCTHKIHYILKCLHEDKCFFFSFSKIMINVVVLFMFTPLYFFLLLTVHTIIYISVFVFEK